MHEGGLAASVAEALQERHLDRDGPAVRMIVHGGHDDASAFDDAFRLHLGMVLPDFDQRRLTIQHTARRAVCVGCAQPFEASAPDAPCPACGAPGLVLPTPESIEMVWSTRARHRAHPRPGEARPGP